MPGGFGTTIVGIFLYVERDVLCKGSTKLKQHDQRLAWAMILASY